MADFAGRPTFALRVPWRTVGVALLIVALLLAAVAIYVGTRQTKLPPPFGVAITRMRAAGISRTFASARWT